MRDVSGALDGDGRKQGKIRKEIGKYSDFFEKTLDKPSIECYNSKLRYNRLISEEIGQSAKKIFAAQGKFRRFDLAKNVNIYGIKF